MIEHLSNIQISLYVAFLIALSLTLACVVCLVIGYVLGRNSAEKPVVAEKKPRPPKMSDDEIVMEDGGDYFMDVMPDMENDVGYTGRIPTMT